MPPDARPRVAAARASRPNLHAGCSRRRSELQSNSARHALLARAPVAVHLYLSSRPRDREKTGACVQICSAASDPRTPTVFACRPELDTRIENRRPAAYASSDGPAEAGCFSRVISAFAHTPFAVDGREGSVGACARDESIACIPPAVRAPPPSVRRRTALSRPARSAAPAPRQFSLQFIRAQPVPIVRLYRYTITSSANFIRKYSDFLTTIQPARRKQRSLPCVYVAIACVLRASSVVRGRFALRHWPPRTRARHGHHYSPRRQPMGEACVPVSTRAEPRRAAKIQTAIPAPPASAERPCRKTRQIAPSVNRASRQAEQHCSRRTCLRFGHTRTHRAHDKVAAISSPRRTRPAPKPPPGWTRPPRARRTARAPTASPARRSHPARTPRAL